MAIKITRFNNGNELGEALKKKKIGFIRRVQDRPLILRFLTEPTEWISFKQAWIIKGQPPVIVTEDNEDEVAADIAEHKGRYSNKYLANAVNTETGESIVLEMPVTLARSVNRLYEKYGTLLEHDIEVSKEGTGTDTEYSAIPDGKTPRDLAKYEVYDLVEALEDQIGNSPKADDSSLDKAEDDDPAPFDKAEDEAPKRRVIKKKAA